MAREDSRLRWKRAGMWGVDGMLCGPVDDALRKYSTWSASAGKEREIK